MTKKFKQISEGLGRLSLSEKVKLFSLLKKCIIEEKRNMTFFNLKESIREVKCGKIKFSDQITTLKKKLKTN